MGGGAKRRKNPLKNYRCDLGNGGDLGGNNKKRRQEGVGLLGADRGHVENIKEAEREAQGAEGLHNDCREYVPFVTSDQRFPMRVAYT